MSPTRDFSQAQDRQRWVRQLLSEMDESRWDSLCRELFSWQVARVPAFRRLCVGRGLVPEEITSWRDIPAVPQQLFKREKLFAHEDKTPAAIYETSGTTTGQPGRQHLLSTDIYRAVSIGGARRAGILANQMDFHFLTPSPREAPHSSLSAMFGFWLVDAGQKGARFWVRESQFKFHSLRKKLVEQIQTKRPVAICGTAFAFVHLLEAWAELSPLRLPKGSRLLETGGFKGRSREIPKTELYEQMARIFTVPDDAIWSEYGMSELSSQAYARGSGGLHQVPPWARVLVCDPATGREVRVGQRGLVRWIDLANVDSVLALQTLDLAERARDGFRLIGRMARTEPRGCSLGADDLASRL